MRHSIAVLVACLVFGSACASVAGKGLAQSPEDAKKVAEQDAADDALQRKLESTVVDVEFNDDALEDAIKAIRDKAGVNLAVQWGAIEITGVKRDRAVSEKLKGVSAARALQVVLDSVSGELEPMSRLDYGVEGGVVKVTTRQELAKVTREETYDVRDLLVEAENFRDAPTLSLISALASSGGGGGGGSSSTFPANEEPLPDENKSIEDLITRIKEHVGTKTEWDENYSVISTYHCQLLLRTTRANHRALAALLAEWRRQKHLSIALQARILRLPAAEVEKLADQTHGTLELTEAQVRELMARATAKDSGIQVLSTGRYRCANGQRTYALAGAEKAFVSDVTPIVGAQDITTKETKKTTETPKEKGGKEIVVEETKETSDPKEAKAPTMPRASVSTVQEGFSFDVEAIASGDHRQVLSTLRCSFAPLAGIRQIDPIGGVHLEAPTLAMFQWRTSTAIPNGGAVLLSATSSAEAGAGDRAAETLLLVQATVVEPAK